MNTQLLPAPATTALLPITSNQELFDQYKYYARRHLYHATIIVTRPGYRYTRSDGQSVSDFAQRWHSLSGYGIDAAYELVESLIRHKWISAHASLRITDGNRGTTVSEYRRHVQEFAPSYLAQTLDVNINGLQGVLMPHEQAPVVLAAANDPWMIKFRMAAIFHVAEQMRHLPFVLWNGVNGCWDNLNVEVIEATYNQAIGIAEQEWDTLFELRYEVVYHRLKGIVRRQTMGILAERIRMKHPILFGINPRTLTPTPPSSDSGSPRSVASGYDPTSDMDISPNRIGY